MTFAPGALLSSHRNLGMFLPAILLRGNDSGGNGAAGLGDRRLFGERPRRPTGQVRLVPRPLLRLLDLLLDGDQQRRPGVRQSTDTLWFASPKVRDLAKMDIQKVYYPVLAIFTSWGLTMMNVAVPLTTLMISANIANFTMAISATTTLRLNRKVLPP